MVSQVFFFSRDTPVREGRGGGGDAGDAPISLYRGTSPIRNHLPPCDLLRTLGICLWYGPKGLHFFASEVPLYDQLPLLKRVGGRDVLLPYPTLAGVPRSEGTVLPPRTTTGH